MKALQIQSLHKTFPPDVVAVDGIDMEIDEGEVFAFLGPNGAGKTTTVRILTTLLRPTSGNARVLGFDIATRGKEIRRRVGVALQEAGLDQMSTGRELLEMQARLFGMSGGEVTKRATELLELVGLSGAANRLIKTYSGGMKRRLDLASALVGRPSLLFLDEPTEGLDPASRQAIWDEVQRLNRQEGLTVFLTTHYLEEADKLAERIAIIDRGRIVADGSPSDLKAGIGTDVVTVSLETGEAERARAVLLGFEGVADVQCERGSVTVFIPNGASSVAPILRVLDQASVKVVSVTVTGPTLDEVFLRATGSRLEGAENRASSEDEEESMRREPV